MNSIILFVPGKPNRFTSKRAKYLSARPHLRLRNRNLLLNAETRKFSDTAVWQAGTSDKHVVSTFSTSTLKETAC